MRRGAGLRLAACAAAVWAAAASAGPDGGPPAPGDAAARPALDAIELLLRGGLAGADDLVRLNDAAAGFGGGAPGISPARGVEGPAAGAPLPGNVYILRVEGAGDAERQIHLLQTQREILRNQLILLKALGAIANHQALLGSRTARVENIVRDVVLGMKSSRGETHKLVGEVAGTAARVTDIAGTTAEMSVTMKEIGKGIRGVEGTIKDMDVMIERLALNVRDQASALDDGFRMMERRMEDGLDDLRLDGDLRADDMSGLLEEMLSDGGD